MGKTNTFGGIGDEAKAAMAAYCARTGTNQGKVVSDIVLAYVEAEAIRDDLAGEINAARETLEDIIEHYGDIGLDKVEAMCRDFSRKTWI